MYRIEIYLRVGSRWSPIEQPAQWHNKSDVWAMWERFAPTSTHTLRIVGKDGKVVYRNR